MRRKAVIVIASLVAALATGAILAVALAEDLPAVKAVQGRNWGPDRG